MNKKKGFISIEALVVAALITVTGYAFFLETKDALSAAAGRTLAFDNHLTQDMGNSLDNAFGYTSNSTSNWSDDEGTSIKDVVADEQPVTWQIALDVQQTWVMNVGENFIANALVTSDPVSTTVVYWSVVSGSDFVMVTADSASGGMSANISAIKPGTAIVRAYVQDKSAFKDIVITVN